MQHPDIVDAAVIGVEDAAQATELPRCVCSDLSGYPLNSHLNSAYVVYKDGVSQAPMSFPKDVQKWIEGRVARHKFLRGGVVVVDIIPKRYVRVSSHTQSMTHRHSAAGKILRRELRERAKLEVGKVKAKL